MDNTRERRVLSIQSHVVHGYVGNKSSTFPLQVLGYDVDAINSVQFCNHTGYSKFTGERLSGEQLKDLFSGLEANKLLQYSHLLTGYIGSESFMRSVIYVAKRLKEQTPSIIYVCDPVMGDNGALYVPKELVSLYTNELVPLADILTPNQFEAEQITGIKIVNRETAVQALENILDRGPSVVVLTSFTPENDDNMYVYAMNKSKTLYRKCISKIDGEFSGTGDLFSALFLAWADKEQNDVNVACDKVLATIRAIILKTLQRFQNNNKDELMTFSNAPASKRELALIQSKKEIENPPLNIN